MSTEEKAMRFNEGKLEWSLVDYEAISPLVETLTFGAKKYARDNWKKGLDKEKILDSMMRHMVAIMDGEEYDAESGVLHTGHIMANCMFYNYQKYGKKREQFGGNFDQGDKKQLPIEHREEH